MNRKCGMVYYEHGGPRRIFDCDQTLPPDRAGWVARYIDDYFVACCPTHRLKGRDTGRTLDWWLEDNGR